MLEAVPRLLVDRKIVGTDPSVDDTHLRIGNHGDTILPNEQPAPAGAIRARYVDSRTDWVIAGVSRQAGSMEPVVPARRANIGNPKISGGRSRQVKDGLLFRQLSHRITSDARCNGFIRISVDVRRDEDQEREKTGLFLTVRPSRPDLADSAVPVRGGMEA